MGIKVYYRYLDEAEKCFPVTNNGIVIGRSQPDTPSVDLNLFPDRSVSRAHAYLFFNMGTWWIRDLNSKHGTYLNDNRVTTQVQLASDSKLKLGDTMLRFEFLDREDVTIGSRDGSVVAELTVGLSAPKPTSETQRIDILAKLTAISRNYQGQAAYDAVCREIASMFSHKVQRAEVIVYRDKELIPLAYFPPEKSYASFTLARRALYTSRAFIWEKNAASNSSRLIQSLNYTTAAIYAPMFYNRQVVGVLHVDSTSLGTPFTQADLRLLSEVASAAAQVLFKGVSTGTFPSIFVSYSHSDQKFIDQLVGDLRRRGVSVWFDERLRVGVEWEKQIQEAIETVDAFVLVMSPSSMRSKYVQSEIEYARVAGKVILPLMYAACEIPETLEKIQYVDIQDNYEKGLTDLFHELQLLVH